MEREQIAEKIARNYAGLQKEICRSLEIIDGKEIFEEDNWEKNIGYGLTCVLRNGAAIEKGGVNFSFVRGEFTPQMEQLLGERANNYSVTGISSIMHPVNPLVPIIHMNIRFFSLDNGTFWFGGGIDLTPHYIDVAEASFFHGQLKEICDRYNEEFYTKFKRWADDYFFIPHRNETRGIGGIFFDRLHPDAEVSFDQLFDFTRDLALAYPEIYGRLVKDNAARKYSKNQKAWQEIRRGRYAEFNLIYDRGTKFGFESNGNAESILISLPATASWEYKYKVNLDSAEYATTRLLRKDIDWINYK